MRRRYLLLKRRRKLKEDGKKKREGRRTVARLLKSIHARTPTKESVDTERWAHSGRLLCANCSNEKARSWAWSKGSAFEPRRKYVLDVYLKLNVLFNLVTVKFLSMALKFPPSSSTNLYNMQREIVGKLLFEAHRRLFYFLQKKKKKKLDSVD